MARGRITRIEQRCEPDRMLYNPGGPIGRVRGLPISIRLEIECEPPIDDLPRDGVVTILGGHVEPGGLLDRVNQIEGELARHRSQVAPAGARVSARMIDTLGAERDAARAAEFRMHQERDEAVARAAEFEKVATNLADVMVTVKGKCTHCERAIELTAKPEIPKVKAAPKLVAASLSFERD